MTDTKNIQVGDVVHVRGTVSHIGEHVVSISWGLLECSLVRKRAIVHVEPRPLKVGDRVRPPNHSTNWCVLAIDGDMVWCKALVGGGRCQFLASALTRIPSACGGANA
jgi:hypothetical protein